MIPIETQTALRNLALECENGNMYVTTTSKLLDYYVVWKYLKWKYETNDDVTFIRISGVHDPLSGRDFLSLPKRLQGITFYIPNQRETRVLIGTKEVKNIKKNPSDYLGRKSIMFPLDYLKYQRE